MHVDHLSFFPSVDPLATGLLLLVMRPLATWSVACFWQVRNKHIQHSVRFPKPVWLCAFNQSWTVSVKWCTVGLEAYRGLLLNIPAIKLKPTIQFGEVSCLSLITLLHCTTISDSNYCIYLWPCKLVTQNGSQQWGCWVSNSIQDLGQLSNTNQGGWYSNTNQKTGYYNTNQFQEL